MGAENTGVPRDMDALAAHAFRAHLLLVSAAAWGTTTDMGNAEKNLRDQESDHINKHTHGCNLVGERSVGGKEGYVQLLAGVAKANSDGGSERPTDVVKVNRWGKTEKRKAWNQVHECK